MTALTDYTACQEVRSALGASQKEVSDLVITSKIYLTKLLENLADIDPGLDAVFRTAKDAVAPSDDQSRLVRLVDSYSAYFVALQLVPVMPTLMPKRITDGKAEIERVDNPYAHLEAPLSGTLSYVRSKLVATYNRLGGSVTLTAPTRTNVAVAALGIDPVTG